MPTTYTPTTAREIAEAITGDVLAAAQVKEYVSNDRLIELLGIDLPEEPEQVNKETDASFLTSSEILDEVFNRDLEDKILDELHTDFLILNLRNRGVIVTIEQAKNDNHPL